MRAMTIEDPTMRHVSEGTRGMVRTKTGIVIGIRHQPAARPLSDDAERVQSALLDPMTAKPMPLRVRVWRAVARWL
jgi:hypothetical protein